MTWENEDGLLQEAIVNLEVEIKSFDETSKVYILEMMISRDAQILGFSQE